MAQRNLLTSWDQKRSKPTVSIYWGAKHEAKIKVIVLLEMSKKRGD